PDGVPRSYRLPYSRPLADSATKARDEIMKGKPQRGLAENLAGGENQQETKSDLERSGSRADPGLTTVDLDQFRLLQQAQRVEFRPRPVPARAPKGPEGVEPRKADLAASRHRQERLLDGGGGRCRHQGARRGVGQDLASMQHDHPVGVADFVAEVSGPKHG